MADYINDPTIINQTAEQAVKSTAQPYKAPVGSHMGINPYTGAYEPLNDITTEQQYNQGIDPRYTSANQVQTYQNIQDDPLMQAGVGMQPLGRYGVGAATGTFHAADNPYAEGTPEAAHYDATHMQAAQGTVDPNSMVQNQMDQILNSGDYDGDGLPDWTQPAVAASNQRMNELGLGASTMAANAQSAAVFNAAMPMAQANAQVVAQLNSQNLSNQQQAMLNNAAWDNAAKQFNAQSEQQQQQFFAGLTSDIAKFNATQQNAMEQFNAGQINSMNQFIEGINNQRDMFNANMQFAIDQSNVQWRRTINTANNAGQNAANQANAANMFNMSMTAQNNMWQQSRDEASWALTASENAANRQLSLVNSSLNRATSLEIMASQQSAAMYSSLGAFGTSLLGGPIGTGISNTVFGTTSTTDSLTTNPETLLNDFDTFATTI